MTENEIKEMLTDIIDNGAMYEYRWLRVDGWSNWKPYRLGEEILYDDSRYEYRKVEKWRVYRHNDSYFMTKEYYDFTVIYEGSKENCQNVLNKTYNSWVESLIRDKTSNMKKLFNEEEVSLYKTGVREGIREFSKKILEKVKTENISSDTYALIQEIIKNLGVEL